MATIGQGKQKVAAIVGFLLFVELSSGILQGFYTPLFGKMIGHWDITDAQITWFMTVQTLAAGVSVPVLSKLGDIYGHRRILRLSIIAVTIGTALVAFAPNFGLALFGRVLVGPLAVWLPLEIAIVHNRLTQDSARKAIGLLVGSITLGALVGAILAGVVSGLENFNMVLAVPVIILALCVVAVFVAVPESTERAHPKIDGIGFAGLAAFMLLLLFGLHQASEVGFANVATWGTIVAALVVFIAWTFWERRAEYPAIDLSLVTQSQLWPAYLISFVLGMVMLGTQTILITFLSGDPDRVGYGFALSESQLSLVTLTIIFPAMVSAMLFSRVAKSLGLLRVLLIGLSAGLIGQLGLIAFHGSLTLYIVSMVVAGLGYGLLLGGLPALIAEEAPSDSTGIATGIYNSLKTLGAAIAGSVFAIVLSFFVIPGESLASLSGYITVWITCAAVLLLGIIVLPILKRNRPTTTVIDLPEGERV